MLHHCPPENPLGHGNPPETMMTVGTVCLPNQTAATWEGKLKMSKRGMALLRMCLSPMDVMK